MATVKEDIISGSALVENIDSIEKTRVFIVEGLAGTASEREWTAISTSGIPAMGTALGSGTLANIKVSSISARPLSDGNTAAMRVEVRYSTRNTSLPSSGGGDPTNPTLPVYRVASSVFSTTTNVDINGNEIKVTYGGVDQSVDVSVNKPNYSMSVSRVEQGINPLAIAVKVIGKVNSKHWAFGLPGVWLCTGVDSDTIDNSLNRFSMTYSFEARAKKDGSGDWNPRVIWIDPTTGKPPANPDNTAEITPVMYESYDFRTLGI